VEPLSIDVPIDVARNHHYRRMCNLKAEVCKKLDDSRSVDDIMLKYKNGWMGESALCLGRSRNSESSLVEWLVNDM